MKSIKNPLLVKSGFSLLEMLISLALGAVLLAAIYQVSTQLNFSLERKKTDVIKQNQTLGELKNLYLLFDNAGVFNTNGNAVSNASNNKKIEITYQGGNTCFSRAYKDKDKVNTNNHIIINGNKNNINSIYCLKIASEKPNENNLLIKDAQILNIRYMTQSGTQTKWLSSISSTVQAGLVKGIYFRYQKNTASNPMGIFAAFNTRN